MSPRTLSIGGATFDLFVRTDSDLMRTCDIAGGGCELHLTIGSKIPVKQIIETAGGGASNTSVALKRLGCDAGFCGVVGSDQWGEFLQKNFALEGVNTDAFTVVEGETTSFSIILSVSSGERIILYAAGTNAHLHDANFDKDLVAKADWIYLNHIHERSALIEEDLFGILDVHPPIHLSWNPGGSQIALGIGDKTNAHLLKHTHLLFLNKEEAMTFTGKTQMDDMLGTLLDAGVQVPCITDGRHGSYAADGTAIYQCPIVEDTPVIDTTGAGDAFGSGMTWGILTGLDLPNALRAGTINATSVLGVIGAEPGLLTDIEMKKRLSQSSLDVRVISSPQ